MIYEYDGYLRFQELSESKKNEILDLFNQAGLEVDLADNYFEFEYSGRDANRKIVSLLAAFATLIENSEGEVRCEVNDESPDPSYEFYSIKSGKLYLQKGKLSRGAIREVENQ